MNIIKNKHYVMRAHPSSIDEDEAEKIERAVDFELIDMQIKMTKVGSTTNIIGGLLVVWVGYGVASNFVLSAWYGALVFINIINILFAITYQKLAVRPSEIKPWLFAYRALIMPPITITWGLIGVLFVSQDAAFQLYMIMILLAVLMSFSLGAISDFTASVVSIISLLLPTIILRTYLSIKLIYTSQHLFSFDLILAICFIILGVFLIITCYIGNNLIKRSIILSQVNLRLNAELEDINRTLDNRVKKRTQQLENSLETVKHQATHDLLTDLPNQRIYVTDIDDAIVHANTTKSMVAVCSLSLNGMNKIYDGLGHDAADLIIQRIANRFTNKLVKEKKSRTDLFTYGIGISRKETFIIIIENLKNIGDLDKAILPIFQLLDYPITIAQKSINLSASVGISYYPGSAVDSKTLLMYSDSAMLAARQHGGNSYEVYNTNIKIDFQKQFEIDSKMHDAIKNNEFFLNFQPIVDLKSGQIYAFETLVRWKSPTLGLIPPDDFISLAESNGMIIPLGKWIINEACATVKEWHTQGFDKLKVAINLSAKQLHEKSFIQFVKETLAKYQFPPHLLEFELTESVAFAGWTGETLKELKALGISLSIDDFGTGYSQFTSLKLFKIDTIKIDKSFVKDMAVNADNHAIVLNTISLAKSLNIKVIAEGVEKITELKLLKEHQCDMIQGYYFSPPVAAEVAKALLVNHVELTINI